MDLILERVQNKFACIIGELCSEPIVLSKFAIWLDLRLAEYKAKGAISLDCLGENPDPIWLKGHEKPLSDSTNITRPYSTSPNQSSSHGGFSYGDQFGHSGENTRPVVFETHDHLSPQIVEVKKESLGNAKEVYPISLHVGGASEKRRDLKRTAFQSDSENFTDSSPSKKWRSSSLQTVTLEETNQSLMSIIGESQDSDEDTVSNSNFQTSFTIPDDQASTSSTSAQPRGDNSSSWSNLQASHSIEEMSMAPQPRQETASLVSTPLDNGRENLMNTQRTGDREEVPGLDGKCVQSALASTLSDLSNTQRTCEEPCEAPHLDGKSVKSPVEVGDWVAVIYNDEWWPGIVEKVLDNSILVICFMTNVGSGKFVWPSKTEKDSVPASEVLMKIQPPFPINSRHFSFHNATISAVDVKLKSILEE